jgi:hypothetical protein
MMEIKARRTLTFTMVPEAAAAKGGICKFYKIFYNNIFLLTNLIIVHYLTGLIK